MWTVNTERNMSEKIKIRPIDEEVVIGYEYTVHASTSYTPAGWCMEPKVSVYHFEGILVEYDLNSNTLCFRVTKNIAGKAGIYQCLHAASLEHICLKK